jgi:hypothetical protein
MLTLTLRKVLAVISVGVGLGLAACGGTASTDPSGTTPSTPTPTAAAVAEEAPEHIHNLALLEGAVYLGTHNGMWMEQPDQASVRVSDIPFDVMGLARAGDRWLASGHPGVDQDAPANLGLQESTDDGRTWQTVSLAGEVDFHRLVASGDVVVGVSSHGGALMRSTDGGRSWTSSTGFPIYDLALDPLDPSLVVGTTEQGPIRSEDGGTSFTPISGAPLIALLAWTDAKLYGVSPEGKVYGSQDGGKSWQPSGRVAGPPEAIAADTKTLVVLTGGTVFASTDGGKTFTPRITGLGAH